MEIIRQAAFKKKKIMELLDEDFFTVSKFIM